MVKALRIDLDLASEIPTIGFNEFDRDVGQPFDSFDVGSGFEGSGLAGEDGVVVVDLDFHGANYILMSIFQVYRNVTSYLGETEIFYFARHDQESPVGMEIRSEVFHEKPRA